MMEEPSPSKSGGSRGRSLFSIPEGTSQHGAACPSQLTLQSDSRPRVGNFERTSAGWPFYAGMSKREGCDRLAEVTVGRLRLDPAQLTGHTDLSGAQFYGYNDHPLLAICDAAATHAIAVAMCKEAWRGSWIVLFGFTFDSEELADALAEAAAREVSVTVLLDKYEALSGAAKGRAGCLQRLLTSHIDVFLGNGDTRPGIGGRGRIHSKTCVTGSGFALLGSSNWTHASQANLETTTFLRLPWQALEDFRHTAQWIKDNMTPLTEAHIQEAATKIEVRSSKSTRRSPSSARTPTSATSSTTTIKYPSPDP